MYKFITEVKSKVDIARPSDCIKKTKEQPKRAVTLLLENSNQSSPQSYAINLYVAKVYTNLTIAKSFERLWN